MIPGYPRYIMEGSGEDGIHDLRIENAQIDDDGEFQCQVIIIIILFYHLLIEITFFYELSPF